MNLPKAKLENIVVQNLNDEILIYNLTTNQAFCLNETAAKVFDACDGKTTFAEVKNKHQLTDEIIYLALDKLKDQNLLEADYISPFAGMNRREVIRKVGLASMIALPVISAIVAPQASQAASGAQSDCAGRGGTCIAGGGNLCAGRANQRVTFFYYQNGGGTCQGTSFASTPNFSCGNTAETTTFDVCRVG